MTSFVSVCTRLGIRNLLDHIAEQKEQKWKGTSPLETDKMREEWAYTNEVEAMIDIFRKA